MKLRLPSHLTLVPAIFVCGISHASVLNDTLNDEQFGKYEADAVVKLSSSYLCHDEDSPFFKRTQFGYRNNFSTAKECVEAGFGLPKQPYISKNPDLYATAAKNVETLQLLRRNKGTDPALDILNTPGAKVATVNPNAVPATEEQIEEASKRAKEAEEEKEQAADFGGFGWNPAVVLLNYNNAEYIEEVRIERNEGDMEGTIFVGRKVERQLALMLEAHYFFDFETKHDFQWGVGPFVSVSLATQQGGDLGSVIGAGVMFGFRKTEGTSMNIGIGAFTDTDFQTLRDNLNDGDKTEFTDSAELIQRRDVSGMMVIFSSKF